MAQPYRDHLAPHLSAAHVLQSHRGGRLLRARSAPNPWLAWRRLRQHPVYRGDMRRWSGSTCDQWFDV